MNSMQLSGPGLFFPKFFAIDDHEAARAPGPEGSEPLGAPRAKDAGLYAPCGWLRPGCSLRSRQALRLQRPNLGGADDLGCGRRSTASRATNPATVLLTPRIERRATSRLALLDNPNHLGDRSPPSYVTSPFVAALIFGDIIPPFGGSNKVRLAL
jgi:hypothetical protein